MLDLGIAYLGGVLTIVSPCILPVLPFVFARTGAPFLRSGLPILVGMAIAFTVVSSLAAFGGGWAVHANVSARWVAIGLLFLLGVALLFPRVGERIAQPVVSLGSRISATVSTGSRPSASVVASVLLGIATGLLWAPCAGPILGVILATAALQGPGARTSLLLFAYAAGAATSLAVALLIGGRAFEAMRRLLGVGEWIRRGIGVAVIGAAVAVGLGADTGILTRLSATSTEQIERGLIDKLRTAPKPPAKRASAELLIEGNMPSFAGATRWLNSPPITAESLRGKVVLTYFWTYSCINCLRSIPYVRAWAEKYKEAGLVVVGVHAPEFAFEKDVDNVRAALRELQISFPVALDNEFRIWNAFGNHAWPALYIADAKGHVRYQRDGEGQYRESERVIRELLDDAGGKLSPGDMAPVEATGAQAEADASNTQSPETYLGYGNASRSASPHGIARDVSETYTTSTASLRLNQWGLAGAWTVAEQAATPHSPGGRIALRFHARDLHLVLGPGAPGAPVRFRVLIDGKAPMEHHGSDVGSDGSGTVTSYRLYQLLRQHPPVVDRLFEIEFEDPGVRAYVFTFG